MTRPGILFAYFEIAVVLTVPFSLILILWYRRAVAWAMLARISPAVGLGQSLAASETIEAFAPNLACEETRRIRRRLAVVYLSAAVAASVVTTFLWFHLPDTPAFSLRRGFVVAYNYCWLLTPTLALMLARSRRETLCCSS